MASGMRPARLLFVVAGALAVPTAHSEAPAGQPCSSREVRAEITSIRRRWNTDTDPTRQGLRAAMKDLPAKYPESVEAHRALVFFGTAGRAAHDAAIADYRTLHERYPDSPLYSYLYARLVLGTDSEKIAKSLVKEHPEFAWGQLLAAKVEREKGKARDETVIRERLSRYMALCPESTVPYQFVDWVSDPGFARRSAASLRKILEAGGGETEDYQILWKLEFKSVPVNEQAAVRGRIRKDVDRLWPLLETDPIGGFDILEGIDLLDDQELRRRAENEILKGRPESMDALDIAQDRFDREYPPPKSGDPDAKRAAYYRRLLGESKRWTERWKDYPTAWQYRFEAVRNLDDSSSENAVDASEGLLTALEKRPFDMSSSYPYPIRVAELYVSQRMRLPESIHLSEVAPEKTRELLLARSLGSKADIDEKADFVRWLGRPTVIEAKARLGEREEAARLLAAMEREAPGPLPANADEGERVRHIDKLALIQRARAGLTVADGKTLDALASFRSALRLYPPERRALPIPAESARRARLLWRQEYASLDGFEAWLKSNDEVTAESSGSWTTPNRVLPDFTLTSADGRMWRLADLKGKTVFIALWATWCSPCRPELPYVQRLYDRLKGRKDVLVLTFSIDSNPGAVGPFLKREKLSFPSLLAEEYVSKLMGGVSIPQTWIVSKKGIVERESSGFSGVESEQEWIQRMEAAIAEVGRHP